MNRIPAWTVQARSGLITRTRSCGLSKASFQANVLNWMPGCSKLRLVLARKRYSPRAPRRLLGKDAEQYLEFLQRKVGICPIPDIGHKLDDKFFRLKRLTGETMAAWSIRYDGVYQRLLAAFGKSDWEENPRIMCATVLLRQNLTIKS